MDNGLESGYYRPTVENWDPVHATLSTVARSTSFHLPRTIQYIRNPLTDPLLRDAIHL